MRIIGLNDAAIQIFEDNSARGFHDAPIENGTLLMLVVSELSEALEADRKGKHADIDAYNANLQADDINPGDREEYDRGAFVFLIKDTFEDEIADAMIRLLDLSALRGIDIEWHIEQKLAYNRTRPHKHGKDY